MVKCLKKNLFWILPIIFLFLPLITAISYLDTPCIAGNSIVVYCGGASGNQLNNPFSVYFPPKISIVSPLPIYYASDNLTLNYNIIQRSTAVNCSSVIYNVVNSTGYQTIANTTLSACQNTTFLVPRDDSYNLTLYSNTSIGDWNSTEVAFATYTAGPIIHLNTPPDNSYLSSNQNVNLTFNISDINTISYCTLFDNSSGLFNAHYSLFPPVTNNGTANFLINLTSDNWYLWNVWCIDKAGLNNFALNNFHFGTDSVAPNLSISFLSTPTGSQTFTFNTNVADTFLNLTTCAYTIYNSTGGIDGLNSNVAFTCNALTSPTATAYGTYTLYINATNVGNHTASASQIFTLTPSSPSPSGGSGNNNNPSENQTLNLCKGNQTTNCGFCGDGVQESPNSLGVYEDFYNCPQDVPGLNIDSFINDITINCFDKNINTICFWTQGISSLESASPFTLKSATIGCFDNSGTCFWTSKFGLLVLFVFFIAGIFIYFVNLNIDEREQTTYMYFAARFKKRRKRRKV